MVGATPVLARPNLTERPDMAKPSGALAHFRAHLNDATDECMIWPFGTSQGYGQVTLDGRNQRVHVLACTARHGPCPPGMEAAHGPCHEPLCWNGAHLSWKTRAENVADKVRDGTQPRGEQITSAKITADDVRAIRAGVAAGQSQASMCAAYGLSSGSVSMIVARKRWAHIA